MTGDPPVEPESHKPLDTRARILAAAARVSCESGPAALSLDAVAAEAGVSKGGLLYHFPSKHELLRSMVQDHADRIRARMDALAPGAREAGDGPRALRAYVQANREMLTAMRPPPAGVFAFLAAEPSLIAPIAALRAEIRALAAACPDPARAALVVFACKGIVLDTVTDAAGAPPPASAFDALLAVAETL